MTNSSEASGRVPETAPPAGMSSGLRIGNWAAVVLVLLGSGLAWTFGQSGPARPTENGWAAQASSDDTDQIMSMLNLHARALLARDSTAWADGLDSSPGAGDYPSLQRGVFDNLARVPLTTWRYTLVGPVTSSDLLAAAAERLGGRTVILHIQLGYALAAVDPQPTGKDEWLTAVRRGGGWKLASDSDVAASGGQSWHGPWDFGPLQVRRGPHTLVLAHPAHAAEMSVFGELVERSVPVVSRVWGQNWNSQVAVLIPDTDAEFAAVTADSGDTRDLAAVSVADQVLPDGTVLGARIVLNPSTLTKLDSAGRRLVVQHELTHIAARGVTSDQMPIWVIEGFADYVGNLGSARSASQIAAELAAEARGGHLPAALPTSADFDGSNARLPQVYEEAWLACRLIADRVGSQGLVRFYKTVSVAARTDPASAAAVGLRTVLKLDVNIFTRLWKDELRRELA
ncbi:MAG: hypothetical protein QOE89_58 [Pseudonocardiales bacterium]|nr:hypothetical protein [Pseudonocardiales bacterium]